MFSMLDINHIHNLADQGYNISEISKLVHVDRKTCRKYLEMDDFSPCGMTALRGQNWKQLFVHSLHHWKVQVIDFLDCQGYQL